MRCVRYELCEMSFEMSRVWDGGGGGGGDGGGGEGGGGSGMQSQKQKPHTMMWGQTSP